MAQSELYQIDTGYACAGVITVNDIVVKTAPIFRWMIGKPIRAVRQWKKIRKISKVTFRNIHITKYGYSVPFYSDIENENRYDLHIYNDFDECLEIMTDISGKRLKKILVELKAYIQEFRTRDTIFLPKTPIISNLITD